MKIVLKEKSNDDRLQENEEEKKTMLYITYIQKQTPAVKRKGIALK